MLLHNLLIKTIFCETTHLTSDDLIKKGYDYEKIEYEITLKRETHPVSSWMRVRSSELLNIDRKLRYKKRNSFFTTLKEADELVKKLLEFFDPKLINLFNESPSRVLNFSVFEENKLNEHKWFSFFNFEEGFRCSRVCFEELFEKSSNGENQNTTKFKLKWFFMCEDQKNFCFQTVYYSRKSTFYITKM